MFHNIKLYLFGIVVFMASISSSFGVMITYDLNGGHLPDSDDTTFSIEPSGDEVFLANPVRDGFTFAGWCEKNDADDGECGSVLGRIEQNGVKTWQWVVPATADTNTEYVALWDFVNKLDRCGDLPQPSVSEGWVVVTNNTRYDFDNDGKEVIPDECGATLLYVTNPSALASGPSGYMDAGIEAFTICRYNAIYHEYFCSVAIPVCSQEELASMMETMYGADGDMLLNWMATMLIGNPNATKDDLVWNQPSDDIEIDDRCLNTCEVQLSLLGVPMCMITDLADASTPALTVIHQNGPYYINLVSEADASNPAPLVDGSEHKIRIITASGTYNVVSVSPTSE